ncbi:MAG: 6-carboxytetrahydropterin synthase QueD [Bacteroidota bacterium]
MPVLLSKEFKFEAAHFLPQMPEGHKCRRLHGHSFRVQVNVVGETDPQTGLLMDFGDIKQVVKPYIELLDHWCINEVAERDNIPLLRNPTSEHIAQWLFEELKPQLPELYSVIVFETCTTRCEYRGKPMDEDFS